MKNSWKQHKIGDFVKQESNSVLLTPSESYTLLGMSLEGRGLFIREQKKGSEIGSKTLNKIQTGDFIYSRLFAWKGAFDFVKEDFNGLYVSDEYPTFKVDTDKLDVRFLHYYFNQAKTWKAVEQLCIGVTKASRNRFKEKFFLNFPIIIPDISTQKRIVSKIESIRNKRDTVFSLFESQTKDINNLLFSKYTDLIKNAEWLPMKDVAPIIRRPVTINDDALYPELGIRCFGNGTFHKPALTGMEVATKKIFQIKTGDLIFSNVFAWEGGIAVAKEEDNDRYGSHRFISCLVDEKKALTEYLCYHFLSPKGLEDINACSPGGAGRNKTLGLDKLMKIKVPVPSLASQKEFVELLRKTNAIKEYHKQTEQDLNELLPSLLDKAFKGELFTEDISESLSIAAEPKASYVPISSIPENKKGFAKQVLGGKIVSLFKDDENFTNIKFQKLQYLAEHIIEVDLNWNYYRQSAGPYDNKFMHTVFYRLQQNQWFENRDYKFYPLKKADDIERHYQNYFGNKEEKLNKLFGLLQNASEKFCEAVATIYAVWNNHIIQKFPFDKSKIKTDFFEWSGRKEIIFSEEEFEQALSWMAKHDITPVGFGYLIKEKK